MTYFVPLPQKFLMKLLDVLSHTPLRPAPSPRPNKSSKKFRRCRRTCLGQENGVEGTYQVSPGLLVVCKQTAAIRNLVPIEKHDEGEYCRGCAIAIAVAHRLEQYFSTIDWHYRTFVSSTDVVRQLCRASTWKQLGLRFVKVARSG